MCFGGGSPSIPAPAAPPPPPPVPTAAAPTDVASQTDQQRAAASKQLQYGILSTIKTSAAGLTGTGADLNTPAAAAGSTGKKTLGG